MKTTHLKTENYEFKVDLDEGDENASTEMYDLEGNLISDNYHATMALLEVLTGDSDEKITFITDEMEKNRQEILKN